MNKIELLEIRTMAHLARELKRCEEGYNARLFYYAERQATKIIGMIELAYNLELISNTEYERLKDRAYTISTNSVIERLER